MAHDRPLGCALWDHGGLADGRVLARGPELATYQHGDCNGPAHGPWIVADMGVVVAVLKPPSLDIRGSGVSWRIYQGTEPVSRVYTSHCNAVAALRGVEQRLNPNVTRLRRCRCGESFLAGRGDVLCSSCRRPR